MGVLDDCPEFINTVGPNVSLFRTGSASTPVDGRLEGAVRAAAGSAGHHLLVSTQDVDNLNLGKYVRSATAMGIDLVVDLYDGDTMGLVTDPEQLDRARELLGAAVGTGEGTGRLVPEAIVRRQNALRTLAEDSAPPSMSRLGDFLSGLEGEHFDIGTMLGALVALGGELPGLSTAGLAGSNAPMASFTAERSLGTGFVLFDVGEVVAAVDRGARALVHGWLPGSTHPQTFLFFSDGGTRYWVDPSKGSAEALTETAFEDGDARLMLEQPTARVLLLDENNQALPVPRRSVASVRDRENPNVTRVGSWSAPTRTASQIREKAGSFGENVILLQVRRGPNKDGKPTLDEHLKRQLAEALRLWRLKNPVVVSTESLEALNGLAAVQYNAKVIAPLSVGMNGLEWEVVHPGGVSRDRYFAFPDGLFHRVRQAGAAKEWLPPMPASLLNSGSWKGVEEFMNRHRSAISTPDNVELLKKEVDAANARAVLRNPLGSGTIGEAPYYQRDRTLPALSVMLDIDVRALTDPHLAGRESMEPLSPFVTDEVPPTNTRFDAKTILGYLTGRAMSLPSDQRLAFNAAVVRLRDMFRPLISAEYGPIITEELAILLGAEGEWASEWEKRHPGAPELHLGHAEVAKVIGDIYQRGLTEVDPAVISKLADAIDCFTGEIRVAYHYLFKLVANPARPREAPAVKQVGDVVSLCH